MEKECVISIPKEALEENQDLKIKLSFSLDTKN